jgi:hypothetical protein
LTAITNIGEQLSTIYDDPGNLTPLPPQKNGTINAFLDTDNFEVTPL